MTYYKVINDTEFIGIGSTYDLREYQNKHNILLISNEDNAEYIQINNILYRDDWFKTPVNTHIQYQNAKIIVIPEEEYQQLSEAIDKNEEILITVQDGFIQDEPEQIPVEETVTIDYLKTQKIKEMSYICNQTITNGFDIELSDRKVHHFSLTVQDQLNLITLSAMMSSGEDVVPYHADGEKCEYFSAIDIGLIVRAATELKIYHTTYYNSLKLYIQSLDNRDLVSDINYGIDIPDEYKSDVLVTLLSNKQ